MYGIFFWTALVLSNAFVSERALALDKIPAQLYSELEYLLAQPQTSSPVSAEDVRHLVNFVRETPAGTSLAMEDRQRATGAFHAFSIRGELARLAEYVYNPDIPVYVTMPSSVSDQEWLTPDAVRLLRELPDAVRKNSPFVLRGAERETITPDANTGGYYAYQQGRAVVFFDDKAGPVLISVSRQAEPSDVGRKGCVVGEDSNWNYLYSGESGLTKTGLGWVDSYMYEAASVLVYASDTRTGLVRIGSFKWLNAGWAKMNMVKHDHILNGIKRFAADFKTVLEASNLPNPGDLAAKYKALIALDGQRLRELAGQYLEGLGRTGAPQVNLSPFKDLLATGNYLSSMSRQEMVKVLLQEYLKARIGKPTVVRLDDPSMTFSAVLR